jgi:hypothetical protein
MIRERLTKLLGENYELLEKSAYYLTNEERWKILQALLYQFGTEFEGEKIIIFVGRENENYVGALSKAINDLIKIQIDYNEQERYWEIKPNTE